MKYHQPQHILKFLAIAAALAGAFIFFAAPHDTEPLSSSLRAPETPQPQDRRRQFGTGFLYPFRSWFDPKSTSKRSVSDVVASFEPTEEPVEVTVLVTYGKGHFGGFNSIFESGTLSRYGTGRVKYVYKYNTECNWLKRHKAPKYTPAGPCVAVAKPQRGQKFKLKEDCHRAALKRDYPQCKALMMNDEQCEHVNFEAHQYFSSKKPNDVYLPLGPRMDTWTSFRKLTEKEGDVMLSPSSQRKYVFNAIFSESTESGRQELHRVIEDHKTKLFPKFVQISPRWSPDANNVKTHQLNTDDYAQVLVNSIFTLAPIGNSPESFRLFEAVEAGTIPIMVFDDNYYNHPCKGSLDAWLDSPAIVLNSWNELYPTIHEMMKDSEALVYRQNMLRTWYEDYMRKTIAEFEQFLLDGNKNSAIQHNAV